MRAQEFLGRHELEVAEQIDARRSKVGPSDLGRLLAGVETVLIARGKRLTRLDGSTPRSRIAAAVVGRTANLRAPAIRSGGLLVVGYHTDAMRELLR